MSSKHDSDDEGQVVSDAEDNYNLSDAEDDDHEHETTTTVDMPLKPSFLAPEASAGPVPFNVEKDCAYLLLEARIILKAMIEMRLKQERIASGNLMVDEIQNLLRSQKEDTDIDWITEIQELKRKLVAEVRRNHGLEQDLNHLDKKIALLIKNRNNIQSVIAKPEKKKKKGDADKVGEFINAKNKELYSNLFYLLQTEPVYLANLLYLCSADEMNSFLDTVILTLFGDAYSPREEFLILSLFKLALSREIKSLSSVRDLRQAETVVIKMILAYNKRKQGAEYSKATLLPLAQQVAKQADLQLEMTPTIVHRYLIDQKEVSTGEKSALDRNLPVDQILELKEVQAELASRAHQLIGIVEKFLDAIINSLPRLPYGIRWICKQVQRLAAEQLPTSTQNDILSVTGYFVYYRFLNLIFLSPELALIERPSAAKNMLVVSKVLQQMFNLTTFSEKHMAVVNDWISSNLGRVKQYLTAVLDVPDPEDHLKVDRYIELTQKTKPVIIISHAEISRTHQLLNKHIDSLVPSKGDDHLRVILKELDALGPVPDGDEDHEVQLTLVNRFESHVEAEINPDKHLYSETKELVIKALSGIPVEPKKDAPPVFLDTLKRGLEHADKTGNQPLHVIIAKTIENMKKLEEKGMIKSIDNYSGFLREVALEVANRQAIREQQKKEVRRLGATVKNLLSLQQYMNDQIRQYNEYLEKCKEQHYQGKNKKKSKKLPTEEKVKPTKFSYSQLKRRGVISSVDESMESVIKKMDFVISSKKYGVFNVVAKLGPAEAKNVKVDMDELLECQANGVSTIDREGLVLNVNLTIHMLNKMLMK